MKRSVRLTWLAWGYLALLYASAAASVWLSPHPYQVQYREAVNQPPSSQFWLGTDELGRDRWSRLAAGSRVSLALAPAAALLAVLLAAVAGGGAEMAGGWWSKMVLAAADLSLSVPTFFLLLLLRALLPLNVSPAWSLLFTFGLLGLLGWAGPARLIAGAARRVMDGEFILAARARGVARRQIWWSHLLPALRGVLVTQFLTLIPVFLLAEANLGMLGLGVTEPLPSWGGLLRELEPVAASGENMLARPWLLAPAALMGTAVGVCSLLAESRRRSA